jgi:hypothetical protein
MTTLDDNGGRDSASANDGGRNDYCGNRDTSNYNYDGTDSRDNANDDSSTSEAAADMACSLVVTRAPVATQVLGLTPRGREFLKI